MRLPDLAFVRTGRLPVSAEDEELQYDGPPDLAIQIISPDDRPGEVRAKVREYLTYGASAVWVADRRKHTVSIHRSGSRPKVLQEDDLLDGGDVLPGFSCRVADLFVWVPPPPGGSPFVAGSGSPGLWSERLLHSDGHRATDRGFRSRLRRAVSF